MKRARKKNGSQKKASVKKEFSGYQSDMLDLGYDPDMPDADEPNVTNEEITADAKEEVLSASETENISDENIVPESETGDDTVSETSENAFDEPVTEQGTASKKHGGEKKPLIFVASLITIILIFVAALGFGGFIDQSDETVDESYTVPVEKGTGKINILLLGVDKDGLRTDTMIVASYDMDVNSVKLLSIPRDTRMYIGNKYQKINAAHAISEKGKIKGVQGSIEAVTRLTSIPINYYVEFSFDAFKNTIDALGGVDFDVPQNMNYDDPTQDLHIHLTKGFQHLDGDKAEQFVRFRSYPMGDIARVEAQQAFIKAVAEQKLNAGIIASIPDLYTVLKDDIKTNFTLSDAVRYANNLSDLLPENITMFQLPGAFGGGEYITSYWLADMDALKTLIETEFGYDASTATTDSQDGSSKAKDSADRRKTAAPKPSQKSEKTATPTKQPTEKPSHTPTHTAKPTEKVTHTPTEKPTEKPTKTVAPTEKPTEKPTKTASPTEKPTEKPSRPTPNPDNE